MVAPKSTSAAQKPSSATPKSTPLVLRVLRILAAAVLAVALFPSLLALGAGVSLHATATNPAYVMDVLRQNSVFGSIKGGLLDSLVSASGLPLPEQTALREALDEGVPVSWLDDQVGRLLDNLVGYLNSDTQDDFAMELPVVELKVILLPSIQQHLGEEFYLNAALGFQSMPDVVDIGGLINSQPLRAARPVWRIATLAPLVAAGASLVLSLLLWLVAGSGARGVATAGGVWAAAGVVLTALAGLAGVLAATRIPASLSLGLAELQPTPLLSVVSTALDGIRSELWAVGTGGIIAGLAALSLPSAQRERQKLAAAKAAKRAAAKTPAKTQDRTRPEAGVDDRPAH